MNFKLHLLACAVLAYPLVGRAQEDGAQLPAALKDCIFLREESFKWYVQFDYEHEGKLFALLYAIGHDGTSGFTKDRRLIAVGETFFASGPATNRFKFLGFTEKEVVSERTKMSQKLKFARFEDLKPSKRGRIYESQQLLPGPEVDKMGQYDRTAVFAFKAAEGQVIEFKVEEFTRFAFPPSAKSPDYLLKEVRADQVLIEYQDPSGATRQAVIGKKPDTEHTNLDIPGTEESKAVVAALEKLEVIPSGIKEVELNKAIDLLNRGEDGKAVATIHFVIRRGSRKSDLPKVSLYRLKSTFAIAIDSLCRQVDCRWTIEIEPETKRPVLVVFPRDQER